VDRASTDAWSSSRPSVVGAAAETVLSMGTRMLARLGGPSGVRPVVSDREADEVVAGCGNDAGVSGNVAASQQERGEGGEGGDEGGEHGKGLRAVHERSAEGARPV